MLRLATTITCMLMPLMAMADALTVTQVIPAGTILAEQDLGRAESSDPTALRRIEDAIGKETRVILYPGRPILARHLGSPTLVERNQIVRLAYLAGGLLITTDGRALGRAGAGESIKILNTASRQTVTGVVREDGSIIVSERN